MVERCVNSTEALPLLNSFIMHFAAMLKSLLTAKSTTSPHRLLLKSNGSFEVVADSDLLWAFIYIVQVFIGTSRRLNVDLYGCSHIKTPNVFLALTTLVPFGKSEIQFN